MSNFPDGLLYTNDHEWARVEGNRVYVGITAHATASLGDITLVNIDAKVGQKVDAGKPFGVVESVKAVSELFAPLTGTVAQINEDLKNNPELVNTDPYGKGWMVVLEGNAGLDKLMSAEAYRAYVATL